VSRALVVCVVAVASGAHADVWQRAITTADPAAGLYEQQMEAGDRVAEQATAVGESVLQVKRNLDAAMAAYHRAAELVPASPEPYYRIGTLLQALYFDSCNPDRQLAPGPLCIGDRVESLQPATAHAVAEHLLDAWAQFEARAPLDPRITASFLFERAILHTKLATPEHWRAAAADYEKLLHRDDLAETDSLFSLATGNLAETYMMLGRLDDALPMYRLAVRFSVNQRDMLYGLAVALDRDEQTEIAEDYIRDAGDDARRNFLARIADHSFFFVPTGESFYYTALIQEAFGEYGAALADFEHFIASGAHKQYQPRARAHIDALRNKAKPLVRRPLPQELDEE
jgi:tetratricopeptide (TPR) repeat protein